MDEVKKVSSGDFKNPFLTESRNDLWEKIGKNAKPISKRDFLKKAESLRNQSKLNKSK